MKPLLLSMLGACSSVQPLVLPEDPAAPGAPVGVRTVVAEGETIEVWYPAPDGTEGEPDVVDLADHLPELFLDAIAEIDPPSFTQDAVRDAPVRRLDGPLPVVVFSHGFGGFRTQSVELTAHLASRGYVVVSADHPGRTLGDVAPCLLTTPTAPCTISFGGAGDDPAVEDVSHVMDWLASGPDFLAEADLLDLDQVGIFGHSAGGVTTSGVANVDPRFDAALAMAGAAPFTRDLPSAVVGGSCDGVVPESSLVEAGATASEGYLSLVGAGHLAFSDLCRGGFRGLADAIAERDDANGLVLSGLATLATDGCPDGTPSEDLPTCDAFLDLEVSSPILRHAVTAFFDLHLKEGGEGLDGLEAPQLVRP